MGKGVDIRRRGEGGYAQAHRSVRQRSRRAVGVGRAVQSAAQSKAPLRQRARGLLRLPAIQVEGQHPDLLRSIPRGIDRNAVHSAQRSGSPSGYWLALHARDKFGTLTIVGIITLLAAQVFLNIGVVTNLIPNTGISLPFFSYGGTALMIQLAEMGIILSISRQIPAPKKD